MKVLVATNIPGVTEFNFVPEDEICYEQTFNICNSTQSCGCDRSLSGTDTPMSTTTVKVAEVDMDRDDLFDLAAKVGRAHGWGGVHVLKGLQSATEVAQQYEVGTMLAPYFDFDNGAWAYSRVEVPV